MTTPGTEMAMSPSLSLSPAELAERVSRLPPLPEALMAVLSALESNTLSVQRCVSLIERDLVLAARTLRLANSAFYGRPGQVGSITAAITLLGLRTVAGVLSAAALQGQLQAATCPDFKPEVFWRSAMAAAATCSVAAPRLGIDASQAFLAGLMHDIGLLMLAVLAPDSLTAVMQRAAQGEPVDVVERELLGQAHTELGGRVARHWHFPPSIVDAISSQHGAPLSLPLPNPVPLASLLTLCAPLVDALQAHLDGTSAPQALATVDEAVWQALRVEPGEREALFSSLAAGIGELTRHL